MTTSMSTSEKVIPSTKNIAPTARPKAEPEPDNLSCFGLIAAPQRVDLEWLDLSADDNVPDTSHWIA